jgi:hypothetical protein
MFGHLFHFFRFISFGWFGDSILVCHLHRIIFIAVMYLYGNEFQLVSYFFVAIESFAVGCFFYVCLVNLRYDGIVF